MYIWFTGTEVSLCYKATDQWLKWSCEAGGEGAHLTKPQRRLERDTGGVDRGKAMVGANPIPIPHPTNLALFAHKITLYSIYNTYNAQLMQAIGGGGHTIAGAQIGAGG